VYIWIIIASMIANYINYCSIARLISAFLFSAGNYLLGQFSSMAGKRKAEEMISLQEFSFECEGSYKFRKMLSDCKIQVWWESTWSSWWSWSWSSSWMEF